MPPQRISEYRFTRRVHFYETDAAGIVHFSWFARYMEEAEHALWRKAGISIRRPESGVGWPRVAISFDFYHPLRFEDEFEIWIQITEIGQKKIHYACVLSLGDKQVAIGTMKVVCTTRAADGTMKSVPIPEEIAMRFEVADMEHPEP